MVRPPSAVERAITMLHIYGDEDRCYNCDCRPWGRWAKLPCGIDPKTVDISQGDVNKHSDEFFQGFLAYAMMKAALDEREG